ncbi:DUF6308 family protein [Rhodococcus sp. USK13]|uniref:DUF6308 family protein n=1 Tax=Rhodococcus sp. USK13 TaxID=2806442 RepID=UPI002015EBAD|nr:DUF6308 family protein [Rhodococcus sp. USK13]
MGVVGTARAHLNPVREALRADDAALHGRLLKIRAAAGLPEEISVLRVLGCDCVDGRLEPWPGAAF